MKKNFIGTYFILVGVVTLAALGCTLDWRIGVGFLAAFFIWWGNRIP